MTNDTQTPNPVPGQNTVKPTLRTLLMSLVSNEVLGTLHVAQVGLIVAYDATKQSATVSLSIRQQFTGQLLPQVFIYDVPVMVFPTLLQPILAGEPCLIVTTDQDLSTWWNGTENQLPPSSRQHDYSDAIAIVGIRPSTSPVLDGFTGDTYNNVDSIFQNENPTPKGQALGDTIVQNTGGQNLVRIRNTQGGLLYLKDKLKLANSSQDFKTIIDSLITHIIAHGHTNVQPGSGVSGPPDNVGDFTSDQSNFDDLLYT